MRQPGWIRGYRIAFALLAYTTIAYQLVPRASQGSFGLVNFFSFFTTQSNLFAATVLLVLGLQAAHSEEKPPSAQEDLVRGAAVVYMATTGIVYGLLLSSHANTALQTITSVPWDNQVLHRAMPLVVVLDWLVVRPPVSRIPLRRALPLWIIYPLLWLAYTLVRGSWVRWYPYYFLDPARSGGYDGVAAYCVAIAIGFLLFSWLIVALVALGRRLKPPQDPPTT